jgi:cell division protein FtsZ
MARAPSDRLFSHTETEPRTRVLVLGLGGAGGNSVARMTEAWGEGPPVIAVNTDAQSLAGCEVPRVLQIGRGTTRGLGANGDMNTGRMAVEESLDELAELLEGVDLLFLVVGLGGGTGGGGAPLLLQTAHRLHVLTVCFATLPFPYESDNRKRTAAEALANIQREADAVVVLPNEKLVELVDQNTGLQEAFRAADQQIAATVHALWYLLNFPGVMNLDFADVRHLVERSGNRCAFGFGEAEGASRVASAVRALLTSPYLANGRALSEASALLINITGGPDLTLADMQGIMAQIKASIPQKATYSFGAMIDPAMRGRLALTALVAEGDVSTRTVSSRPDGEEPSLLSNGESGESTQTELPLEGADRGRFSRGAATIYNGEDLDIPTYIRRRVRLSFER